jgi:2-methylcitrate synthase
LLGGTSSRNAAATRCPPAFKPKKSVFLALSGTPAGNTALCTVGHSGNDLHYRGYDIKDLARHCEYEEVAHLLVHGKLPNAAELAAYKASLRPLRSLPAAVKAGAGTAAAHHASHGRAADRRVGAGLRAARGADHNDAGRAQNCGYAAGGARVDAALLAPLRAQRAADRGGAIRGFDCGAFSASAARGKAKRGVDAAMQASLILYAEHEFNASTFTARVIAGTGSDLYSCIAGAIGALKGPKHGGANEVALEIQQRYRLPMRPRPIFGGAWPSAKSLSASGIRSTPSAIRAATL